jgi:hypothetical protein
MHLPQVIRTSLNYWPADGPVKRELVLGTVGAYRRPIDTHSVSIEDVRGHERMFNLDVHGFQFIHHDSPHVASFDEAVVKKWIYPEAEEILKNV